jgi:hypothetical protein
MEAQPVDTKHISVPFLGTAGSANGIDAIADRLRKAGKHPLAYAPWSDKYPSKASVQFAITFGNDSLYLQYDVAEPVVQAAYGKNNEPVYQDSCVEAFFSFDGGESYYNFEFNCIGTVLAAFGRSKTSREFLPDTVLQQLKSQSIVRKEGGVWVNWEFTVAIPYSAFQYHPVTSLQGQQCRANFYKCGDNLPEPHFLCWSPIQSMEPNFHLPEFFGTLSFASEAENIREYRS